MNQTYGINNENKVEEVIEEFKEITLPDPVKSIMMKKPKELYLECESEPEEEAPAQVVEE